MNVAKRTKGFTIIEVVLVLAIAGLIFMMVFLALPALQRSQRDTQRKSDLGRAITAITNYAVANRGNIPTAAADFTTLTNSYLLVGGDTFIDPAGAGTADATATSYQFTALPAAGLTASFTPATQNIIYYSTGATCSATSGQVTAAGSKKVSLMFYLESGGIYCQNN